MTAVYDHPKVTLTDTAALRIAKLIEQEGNPDLALRLSISGGGCAGFSYNFRLDDTSDTDDVVFENGGVRLVIDLTSLTLLGGSEIDFVEDLMGASFQVRNPNASSTCGCGTSFGM